MTSSQINDSILSAAALTAFVLAARKRASRTQKGIATVLGAAPASAAVTPGTEKIPLALRVRGPRAPQ